MDERRRKFVSEYVRDFNGAQAAIRAGYSPRRARQAAYELLRRDDVRSAIAEIRDAALRAREAEAAARTEQDAVTQAWVIDRLVEIVRRSMSQDKGRWQAQAATRALELLGRHLGMFDGEPERPADHVPLADRLAAYTRAEAIEQSAGKVVELRR